MGKHRKVSRRHVKTASVLMALAGISIPQVASAAPGVGAAPGLSKPVPAPLAQAAPAVSYAAQPLVQAAPAPVAPTTVVVDNRPIVVENVVVQETSPGLLVLDPQAAAKLDPATIVKIFGDNIREEDVPVLAEAAAKSAAAGVALGLPVVGLTTVGGAVIGGAPGAVIGGTTGAVAGTAAGAITGAALGTAAGAAIGGAAGATAGGAILGIAGTTVATPIGAVLVPALPVIPGVAAGTVAAGVGALGGGVLGAVAGGAIGAPVGAVAGGVVGAGLGGATGAVAGGVPGAATGGLIGAGVGGVGAAALGTAIGVGSTPAAQQAGQRIIADAVWDAENETRIRNGYQGLVGEKPGGTHQGRSLNDLAGNPVDGINQAVDGAKKDIDARVAAVQDQIPFHIPTTSELGL
ncbi:hypothetical protein GSS88_00165 [Corynebacterium sp. 3HC-13]|uniref:hypothetical protein n=1 Tax=Corynebacterium poyangense TaxID=2684405 RepID=UPI001CCF845D|nr:hypothetical protein [Corynebacterium poyangense]MBZ8176224.1 hypothetical protein [Corynebacterium poyangense]